MNIKKLLSTALSTALVLSSLVIPVSVSAEVTASGTCGAVGNENNVTWSYDDSTTTLTISGTGAMADYDDSDKSTWAPWWKEEDYRKKATKIVISSGITNIGREAFSSMVGPSSMVFAPTPSIIKTNITVEIPDTVTSIGDEAFQLSSLSSIVIPDSVSTIGAKAFYSCGDISNIKLGSGVQTIGSEAFASCGTYHTVTELNINIPASVTSIASNAFDKSSKAVISYSGSDKDVAQALDTSDVKSVEAAVPSAVITPTYVDSETGDVPSEGTEAKPAFTADLNDGGATGFVTKFDNSKSITTTNISSITWDVTSDGVTKRFTSGTHMQLAAKADAYITFIVKNLYDPNATVVTTIN